MWVIPKTLGSNVRSGGLQPLRLTESKNNREIIELPWVLTRGFDPTRNCFGEIFAGIFMQKS